MTVTTGDRMALTEHDWLVLMSLAREAIHAQVKGLPPPSVQEVSPALAQRAGVFVTLYRHGRLRGCVGTLTEDAPLHRAVARMAIAAAFEDYRFPPLSEDEVEELTIEISVLSPLREVTTPDDIVVGVHGVALVHDGQRAVFLPKVAVEQGWERETLLEQLCHKAGLPGDAWNWPGTKLFVFTVQSYTAGPEHRAS
ncbi:MAG: AmmeMemoRadiSam system protein A [Candidatus Binatia bacterium]|nr:AmmeMemoRadiSam system protein A [Candidatus Binatia bacterium]